MGSRLGGIVGHFKINDRLETKHDLILKEDIFEGNLSQFLLLTIVRLRQVTENIELENSEPVLLRANRG